MADHRLLPDREAHAVAELERERRLLVVEAELLRVGEGPGDLGGGRTWPHPADGVVQEVAAALVGVDLSRDPRATTNVR